MREELQAPVFRPGDLIDDVYVVTGKQLEGRFKAGERVTVIEDVVTTGGDSLRSIEALTNAGLDVIHLVVVLDRGEGGEENIREARIAYSPLFRIQDLELD